MTQRRALRAGVTAALTAGFGYDEAHDLAASLQGVAEAMRWRVRHDLAQDLVGVALFGEEGVPAPDALKRLPSVATEPPAPLAAEACHELGYEILPDPPR
ncbi:MAG TPA: hypothetical protein VFM58_07575 [Solirubrobacteraceae bacterium]|nr:hypothetical protein [Solirubrobacteraceae bacterium]